jgi:hypothetical protein
MKLENGIGILGRREYYIFGSAGIKITHLRVFKFE